MAALPSALAADGTSRPIRILWWVALNPNLIFEIAFILAAQNNNVSNIPVQPDWLGT